MNQQTSRTHQSTSLMALDAGLMFLGVLVVILVLRLLRFDDPNLFYNAWTYLLAIPTLVIATSMLTRVLANDAVEKSIQLGFLLSVLLHLLLTFFSLNVVLFSDYWPANIQKVAMVSSSPSKAPQYFEPSQTQNESRPDYLKPVKTEQQAVQDAIEPLKQPDEPAKLDALAARDQIEPKLADKPFEQPRKEAAPSQPAITSAAKQLERPEVTKQIEATSTSIDVPKVERAQEQPPQELKPMELDTPPSQSDASRTVLTNEPLKSDFKFDSPDRLKTEPKLNSRPRTDPLKNDSDLEKALARRAEELPVRPDAKQQAPRSPEAPTEFARSSVPVPSLSSSKSSAQQASDAPFERETEMSARSRDSIVGGNSRTAIAPSMSAPSLEPSISRASEIGLKQSSAGNQSNLPSESAFLADPRFAQQSRPSDTSARDYNMSGSAPAASQQIATDEIAGATSAPQSNSEGDLSRSLSSSVDISRPDVGSMRSRDASGATKGSNDTVLNSSVGAPAIDQGRDNSAASILESTRKGLDTVKRDISFPEIKDIEITIDRFRRPDVGGPKIANSQVPIPAPAFSQRLKRNRDVDEATAQELGPLGPQTEAAIERGLQFLSKFQRGDGSWYLEDFGERVEIRSPTAATALALLSFQGAGYTHQQFKYEGVCKKALQWMIAQQKPSGDLYVKTDAKSDSNAWLYSHAIATLALCETYGMTQDPEIKDNAQRAINFLVQSQDVQGGGWRYQPKIGSDTSVTGWCMMALKSAELSGLAVPQKSYEGIEKWLKGSQASDQQRYLYRYNWLASDAPATRHGRTPTPVMTSVGLLMRLYLGWKRDKDDMAMGADWLLERLPAEGTVENPQRDTYYWYYSTQVLFHMGGERWRVWYGSLYPLLIQSQLQTGEFDGSWEPNGKIPDAWGRFGGRLYVTTLNLLSLEVYYRHLPIYDATAD